MTPSDVGDRTVGAMCTAVHNITGGPRPFSAQLFEMTAHIATWSSVCPIDCLQCSSVSFCIVWQQFRDEKSASQRGSFRGEKTESPVLHLPEVAARFRSRP